MAVFIVGVVVVAVIFVPVSYVLQARRRHRWQAEVDGGAAPDLATGPPQPTTATPASLEAELRLTTRDLGPGR